MKIYKNSMRLLAYILVSHLMVSVAISDEISLGSAQAPVTIIEYGSLTCGNCLRFHKYTYPQVKKHYIDTGIVRFTYRHFPTGASAVYGARAANCSGEKYYEMLDKLFSTVGSWSRSENMNDIFIQHANSLGVNSEAFRACIRDEKHVDDILEQQKTLLKQLDVTVTPTFLINGKVVHGKRTFDEMKALISEALN